MAEKRPMRMCDSCGQVDDHPRHVYGMADGEAITSPAVAASAIKAAGASNAEAIIAQIQDTTTLMKHMDCCKADGCPDGSCDTVTAGAEGKTGDALVRHLTKGK